MVDLGTAAIFIPSLRTEVKNCIFVSDEEKRELQQGSTGAESLASSLGSGTLDPEAHAPILPAGALDPGVPEARPLDLGEVALETEASGRSPDLEEEPSPPAETLGPAAPEEEAPAEFRPRGEIHQRESHE